MLRNKLFRRLLCLVLACIILGGCAAVPSELPVYTEETTEPTTEPGPTAPPDGDPNDITARGSYLGTVDPGTAVASVGDAALTADLLQLYYGLTVSQWRAAETEPAPDWDLSLDVQECPLDTAAITWQQFFLQRALDTWHLHAALIQQSKTAVMKLDPEFLPSAENHEKYMEETMPVMEILYGRDPSYKLNELNAAFMDTLPDLLEGLGGADALAEALGGSAVTGENLLTLAELLNEAYAYFIWARWQALPEEEPQSGDTVTFRHVLLIPGDGDWEACEKQAQQLLDSYLRGKMADEARFAVVANENSMDEGTRLNGGLYEYVAKGQTVDALDAWLFDPARTAGETAVIRSDLGVHIVYFRGRFAVPDRSAVGRDLIAGAMEQFPMTVKYPDIRLEDMAAPEGITMGQLLYPDIAHEYIPYIPVYLQQDFPNARFNHSMLANSGCGITTLAMLATYMADEWLTPPVLASRYGKYYVPGAGTDAAIFTDTAPEMGYFLEGVCFNWTQVKDALDQGHITSCLQRPGLFTFRGHYMIMAENNPDGTISLRDSNIYNYTNVQYHKDDRFTWDQIKPNGVMYWIWQDKITRVPACDRCGGETGLAAPEGLLESEYICGKCLDAIARTEDLLNYFG